MDTHILRTPEGSVVAAIEPESPVVVGSLGEEREAVPAPPTRA